MALLYKLDVRDAATKLFSDTGKTTAITDGTALAVWSPSSGSITDDTTQSTLTNRPIYRSNYNSSGYAGVEFDGTNDFMRAIDANAWDVSAITVIVAARLAVATGDRLICHKWDNGNWNGGWGLVQSSGRYAGAVNTFMSNGPTLSTGAALMWVRTTGSYRDSGYNGTFNGTSVSGSNPSNANQFTIGGGSSLYYMSGAIHYVSVWDTALTNSEMDAELYSVDQAFGLGQYAARASGGVRQVNTRGGADQ